VREKRLTAPESDLRYEDITGYMVYGIVDRSESEVPGHSSTTLAGARGSNGIIRSWGEIKLISQIKSRVK